MTLPSPTDTSVMLDVRDRLARIEVKIDNTNDKIKSHETRMDAMDAKILAIDAKAEAHADELAAYRTRVKTIAAIAVPAMGLAAWVIDHLTIFAALTNAK